MDDRRLLLVRGLAALAIDCGEDAVDRLMRYIAELEAWNPSYGLVNASGDDLIIKHILDSLGPFRIIESLLAECDAHAAGSARSSIVPGASVSDLGSGAGLPGIPLSIIFPQRRFRLYERMDRRVRFLETQKLLLGLSNVEICEAETDRPDEPYDIAVFRAFRPFSETKLFRGIWKNTRVGGALAAYKGKVFNANMELEQLRGDPVLSEAADSAEVMPVWVPFLEEERCMVILRK
ncbi:MAG: class I SAM-dependent methyltransferase [Spirochaetaceae bacterium]|nr:class I SAM-dependent methyltransferase [Spirochaetaceae bacterium]